MESSVVVILCNGFLILNKFIAIDCALVIDVVLGNSQINLESDQQIQIRFRSDQITFFGKSDLILNWKLESDQTQIHLKSDLIRYLRSSTSVSIRSHSVHHPAPSFSLRPPRVNQPPARDQPASQSISQSVSQSASQPISQSASQPVSTQHDSISGMTPVRFASSVTQSVITPHHEWMILRTPPTGTVLPILLSQREDSHTPTGMVAPNPDNSDIGPSAL